MNSVMASSTTRFALHSHEDAGGTEEQASRQQEGDAYPQDGHRSHQEGHDDEGEVNHCIEGGHVEVLPIGWGHLGCPSRALHEDCPQAGPQNGHGQPHLPANRDHG